jgi:hypothetical protein
VLRKQFEQRFAPLSEPVLKRLETAGAEYLDRWGGRVLTAGTPNGVLEG